MDCFNHSLFGNSFSSAFDEVEESVLDFPSGKTLSTDVWRKDGDGYVLTDSAYDKAKVIIDWAVNKMDLKNPKSRIVGSIGSNTFNDSSDIDIHIIADNVNSDNAQELNKELMTAFKRKFIETSDGEVNGHPFEVFLQPNGFQDEMSVGCFDFDNKTWISGPEILDSDFNPYEEYYDDIKKNLSDLSDDLRMHVLECGEVASVIQKIVGNVPQNDKFLKKMEERLRELTVKSREIFERIREKRTAKSSPKSSSEAHKSRDSKDWKIADSSFKFLDKLGYIAAVLAIAKSGEGKKTTVKKLSEDIISAIHDNLFNKDRTGYADIDKK